MVNDWSQYNDSQPNQNSQPSQQPSEINLGTGRDQPGQERDELPFDCQLSAYDYELPEHLIAQAPMSPRDHSRLLVRRSPYSIEHRHFYDLTDYLQPGDLLVLNNTRVIPARLYGHKLQPDTNQTSAALVEVFLLEQRQSDQSDQWLALVRPGKRLRPGAVIQFGPTSTGLMVHGQILAIDHATGGRIVQFSVYELPPQGDYPLKPSTRSFWHALPELGTIPLPPYIANSSIQSEQYQTVYGDRPGAVAAPTAGLHFTSSLLKQLEDMGVGRTYITLHVGVGTFRPVEVENITTHEMHGEWIDVSEQTMTQIQRTKAQGGRVIAVGTTATRALEGAAQQGQLKPFQGKTNIFIYPGYQWRVIDGLITNFHLPKSSLMMMVSALIGRETLLNIYQDAIQKQYRFYSFGDAMLLLND